MNRDPSQCHLVVFDLIGTLADSAQRYGYAFGAVCQDYGVPAPDLQEVLQRLGNKNLKQIIQEFVPELPEGQEQGFMSECNRRCDRLLETEGWHEALYDGVPEALLQLRNSGAWLGIYTGTREA